MKKPRSPKEPIKAVNSFYCPTCDETMDGVEPFKAHLKEQHGITDLKGTRKMTLHLDCQDSYHSEFEWEIGGLQFRQATANPRRKSDLMRFT